MSPSSSAHLPPAHPVSAGDRKTPHVAVTAYGVTSCLGSGIDALREALKFGLSGLNEEPRLPADVGEMTFPACIGVIAGELPAAPPRAGFQLTRQLQIAWQTAQQIDLSVREAAARWGSERVGLILGTSTGAILATELALLHYQRNGTLPPDYSCEDGHAMDAAARYLAQTWNIEGPVFAVSAACASGAKALASAKRLIESGICDAVVAGGVDSLCRMTIHGFHSLGVLSPQKCAPFEGTMYGMNVAEGGALLLLEREYLLSRARGYLLGVGESSDAYHMSAPDPEGRGQALAMNRALENAGLEGAQIEYLNAHGTGTQANDEAEALAVHAVLPTCPTSSTKGLTGHQLGAAGATEAVIALEVLQGLELCATGSLTPEKLPLEGRERAFVQSNSFAFGGANISLVFGRAPHALATPTQPQLEECTWGISSAVSSLDLDTPESMWGSGLLPARARARAGTLTRLCAELTARSGLTHEQLAKTPVVFSSALGQLQITCKLIDLFLAGDSSPLAFQNSVHNSVFGTLSLALSNREPSSSLAGGRNSTFCALLEATTLLWTQPEVARILVICADEEPPRELGLPHKSTAGAAFLISRDPSTSKACLEFRRGVPSEQALLPEQFEEKEWGTDGHLSAQGVAICAHLAKNTASRSNGALPMALRAHDFAAYFLVTPYTQEPLASDMVPANLAGSSGGSNGS